MARIMVVFFACAVLVSGIVYLTCNVFAEAESKGVTAARNIVATAIIFRHGEKEGINNPREGSFNRKLTQNSVVASNDTEEVQCRICDNEFLGLLTKKGIGQLYYLGVLLRSKYEHLFPESGFFDPSTMGIMSSAVSRTIMSLESFMAGFLPPPDVHGFLPISWQPFTFKIDYSGEIIYVNFHTKSCPKFYKLLNDLVLTQPPVSKWLEEDKEMIMNLTTYYGYPLNNFFDLVFMIDQMRIEWENSDPWLVEAFIKLVKYITNIYRWMNFDSEMTRIRSGVLLTQMVQNMLDIVAKTATKKNILIYSGHDLSVYSLACALNVVSQLDGSVEYGDTIMVDLIQRDDKEPEVEVIYLQRESGIQILLRVPECGQPCYLSSFVSLTESMMVDDYREICKL